MATLNNTTKVSSTEMCTGSAEILTLRSTSKCIATQLSTTRWTAPTHHTTRRLPTAPSTTRWTAPTILTTKRLPSATRKSTSTTRRSPILSNTTLITTPSPPRPRLRLRSTWDLRPLSSTRRCMTGNSSRPSPPPHPLPLSPGLSSLPSSDPKSNLNSNNKRRLLRATGRPSTLCKTCTACQASVTPTSL